MPKVEVKNMNSLRAVFGALEYEFQRQIEVVENGGIVAQETRGWVEDKGITVSQRSKEYAHDYRYFPEPDLPRLVILDTWVKSVSDKLPELPEPRKDRFISQYGLSSYDASLITTVKSTAEFFEETLKVHEHSVNGLPLRAKGIANWISGESARLVNQTGSDLVSSEMTPEKLSELMDLLDEGVIGSSQAKIVFEESFIHGDNPRSIVEKLGLAQVTNVDSMTPAIDKVLEENSQAVSDYLAGKETAIKFLIGQVMKDTKGKANPNLVSELLTSRLDSREL
jgi:aspartyl-tRNA(Asn)/glutamyl-tRNA(Gln) amidotransferase subunit B